MSTSKVVRIIPFFNRVASTTVPSLIAQYNFIITDGLAGGGSLSVKASSTEDFASPVSSNPTQYSTSTDGTSWSLIAGNVVAAADLGKQIKIDMPAIGAETQQFFKIVYTEGIKVFESPPMMFTSWTQIEFVLNTPVNRGSVRPKKLFVSDVIHSQVASSYTIKVEVSINALDGMPTWEDMTSAYLSKGFFESTNFTKSMPNWAIAVRYRITKANATDVIEISEFNISWV